MTARAGRAGAGGRPSADPVRRVAYDVLYAVDSRGAYANLLLPALLRDRGITGRDAAFATELTYGTLRGTGSYDAVIDVCSDRPVARIDGPLRPVLRLGAHQVLATRVARHAAVSTAVDLARSVTGAGPAGFVNAVLRKVGTRSLDEWLDVVAPEADTDPVGHLAARHGYPRWIAEVFLDALAERPGDGLAETGAALAAGNVRPPTVLAAVPHLAERTELLAATATRWSPFGAVSAGGDPAAHPAVAQRRAIVQDEASQLAALLLARAPVTGSDARWLDMCAGPGGKTAVLAGLAVARSAPVDAHPQVVAADVRPHRAGLVRSHTRLLPNVTVLVADGRRPGWRAGAFDRVLVDVPCSGLGALRRRPEARWRKTPGDVAALVAMQRELLHAAVDTVRPGGVVGYVTCSPHPAETREVVAAVAAVRTDVTVLDAPALLPEVPDLRAGPDGRYAQFWPHRHGTDAIFVAALRRTG